MALQVTKVGSHGKHDTIHVTIMTSRCPDDENRTPIRQHHPHRPTASLPSISWNRTPARRLLSLAVVVVVVAGLAGPVSAGLMDFSAPEVIQYGTCAQPKDQQPFDFRQFSGLWYQVEMVPNSYQEAKKCITLHFDFNGKVYNVTTKGLNEYDEVVYQDATISEVQPKDPATSRPYLKISASGVPPVPYHVVKTDYHSYACVYSCFEIFSLMFEAFSVLSRHPEEDHARHQACHRAFAALKLDQTRLHSVHQGELCLGEGLEGSGEEPPRRDEEDEDENALVALTSGEVNQSGASNAASDPAVEEAEGRTLMEELEEEEERAEDEEAQEGEEDVVAEEEDARIEGSESFSFANTNLESGGAREIEQEQNRATENNDLEGENIHRRKPKKHRRKKIKGTQRKGKEVRHENLTLSMTSRDQQLYQDNLQLDSLYYPEMESGRRGGDGGGGGVRGEDGRVETSVLTIDLHGGAGGVEAPVPLMLLVLPILALCARMPPMP